MTTTEFLSLMINEDELSLVNRYGLEEEYVDEIRCDLCECWFDEVEETFCSGNNRELLCGACTRRTISLGHEVTWRWGKKDASATTQPSPSISPPTPSTSHNRKLVSSPHSNIITMAQLCNTQCVNPKKWGQGRQYNAASTCPIQNLSSVACLKWVLFFF